MSDARVVLWGRDIGAVSWVSERERCVFQYAPEFVGSNIQVAPFMMPLRAAPYEFPGLAQATFKGLPGLLADSLPDKFGDALINAWLAEQGRLPASFSPVDRLCYIGTRGMGALEFQPMVPLASNEGRELQVQALVELASAVLDRRAELKGAFSGQDDSQVIEDILRVGTSAGGARAKAILAWNPATNQFRSGQLPAAEGYSYWLMKFDGVSRNADKDLADPQGYGLIEYAYHLMALAAGVHMSPCRVHAEGGRSHFMTQRFDRDEQGNKLHMQSLCALLHYDFNLAGAYSYEQALQAILRLRLPYEDIEQQFRRAVFNVVARNQDDHVKNIAFLMDRAGEWRLSPAFDVAYAYNPDGDWTNRHQMSLNGKRDEFTIDDFVALGKVGGLKARKAQQLVADVCDAVRQWREFQTRRVSQTWMQSVLIARCG